jgi:hypothetical protein
MRVARKSATRPHPNRGGSSGIHFPAGDGVRCQCITVSNAETKKSPPLSVAVNLCADRGNQHLIWEAE